ncbi:MAG: toll/interleukin-1 receptor domain-containing protein [Ktedonobacteraceae bacterium]
MSESHTERFFFISYSRANSVIVLQLKSDLEAQGFDIWIDREKILPGNSWQVALRDAIRAAMAVLYIATPEALDSKYVIDELSIADMYKRPIYPLWAGGSEWMNATPIGQGGTQYINIREESYQQGIQELVKLLRELHLAAVTQPLDKTQKPRTAPVPQFTDTGAPPRNPYKGLDPFRSKDEGDFFGRDSLIADLVKTVRKLVTPELPMDANKRLLAVLGPSGSGKSSVVMAGLLPRLRQGILPGSEEWMYIDMVPGQHPVEALEQALADFFPSRSFKTIREDLEEDSSRGLHRLLASLTKSHETKVVLFIDQFEELFTQTVSENERQHFLELLVAAVTEPQGPLLVLLTLRADFYDRPMKYLPLYHLLEAHRVTVLPMEYEDLRRVIEQPAQLPLVRLAFEDNLVGDILFDIRGQSNALPLLQFTLVQLFNKRKGHLLTQQAYQEIGGVKGALAQHAEKTYTDLPSEEHQKLAQILFGRLIDPGAAQQDMTRRRALVSEFLLQDTRFGRLMRETMDYFINARLLTTNEVAGVATIEISHEALIREWPRCTQWMQEIRENFSFQRDVIQWEQSGRIAERLYHGSQLKATKKRVDRILLNEQEIRFLHTSIVHQRQQRIRMMALFLLPVFIVGLVLTPLLIYRPSWCPTLLCPAPQPLISHEGVHDSNLQVILQTFQSSFKVLSSDPSTYNLGNLPTDDAINDAQLIATSQTLPYRVVLGIHSLQQGKYGLVIDQITMVISKVAQEIPYPLRVWIKDNVPLYNNNLYRVTYRGQGVNAVLTALYTQPFSIIQLLPGETDELSLEVRSSVVADILFQVQVTYHVVGQLVSHTLLLPNVFEIIFSDPSNWHPYQFQTGHLIPTS